MGSRFSVNLRGTNRGFRAYSNLRSSISQRQPVNWVMGNDGLFNHQLPICDYRGLNPRSKELLIFNSARKLTKPELQFVQFPHIWAEINLPVLHCRG